MFGGHQFVMDKVFVHPDYDSETDEKDKNDESSNLKELVRMFFESN